MTFYYGPHVNKSDYDRAFNEARSWALSEGSADSPNSAARIYHVKERSLRRSIDREKLKKRAPDGIYRKHGGSNKILNEAQEEAIRQYCWEQWELGLGATHRMVYASICHLKKAESPPGNSPSWSWFEKWLRSNSSLHTIKTKPNAYARLESHTEKDVEEWFRKCHKMLDDLKVTKGKNIMNMDESEARIGCPTGEKVIVPSGVKEMYTASSENRKSVTIIETIFADGRKPIPPFIIAPGKHIMDNWIVAELVGDEKIDHTETGYTNNIIAMKYLDHLIKHSHAGPDKPWKVLLLDSHESYQFDEFQKQHCL